MIEYDSRINLNIEGIPPGVFLFWIQLFRNISEISSNVFCYGCDEHQINVYTPSFPNHPGIGQEWSE